MLYQKYIGIRHQYYVIMFLIISYSTCYTVWNSCCLHARLEWWWELIKISKKNCCTSTNLKINLSTKINTTICCSTVVMLFFHSHKKCKKIIWFNNPKMIRIIFSYWFKNSWRLKKSWCRWNSKRSLKLVETFVVCCKYRILLQSTSHLEYIEIILYPINLLTYI
jgi:hypothetical protein